MTLTRLVRSKSFMVSVLVLALAIAGVFYLQTVGRSSADSAGGQSEWSAQTKLSTGQSIILTGNVNSSVIVKCANDLGGLAGNTPNNFTTTSSDRSKANGSISYSARNKGDLFNALQVKYYPSETSDKTADFRINPGQTRTIPGGLNEAKLRHNSSNCKVIFSHFNQLSISATAGTINVSYNGMTPTTTTTEPAPETPAGGTTTDPDSGTTTDTGSGTTTDTGVGTTTDTGSGTATQADYDGILTPEISATGSKTSKAYILPTSANGKKVHFWSSERNGYNWTQGNITADIPNASDQQITANKTDSTCKNYYYFDKSEHLPKDYCKYWTSKPPMVYKNTSIINNHIHNIIDNIWTTSSSVHPNSKYYPTVINATSTQPSTTSSSLTKVYRFSGTGFSETSNTWVDFTFVNWKNYSVSMSEGTLYYKILD